MHFNVSVERLAGPSLERPQCRLTPGVRSDNVADFGYCVRRLNLNLEFMWGPPHGAPTGPPSGCV